MPEHTHPNPFEDHINSESFDVSYLGSIQERSDFDLEMEAFLDSLADAIDYSHFDCELDSRQQAICSYLTDTLSRDTLRDQYGDALESVSDMQLRRILTVPVAVAMLAQQNLCEPEPYRIAPTEIEHPAYDKDYVSEPSDFRYVVSDWLMRARAFIIRLFRRS